MARRTHVVNGSFEIVGAVLAWHSVVLVCVAQPAGVSWFACAFSAVWAAECVPYYLAHGDRLSAAGAVVRGTGNAVWSLLALRWYL